MKFAALFLIIMGSATTAALAQNYGTGSNPNSHAVSGYYKSNGSYVQPHYQTNPNNSTHDNYGARGNYNYHNGQYGSGD